MVGLVRWFNKVDASMNAGGVANATAAPTKVNLLRQVLAMIVKVLLYDYERCALRRGRGSALPVSNCSLSQATKLLQPAALLPPFHQPAR